MTWDYSAINHWWVAFGGDDRVWKITVTPEGNFSVHEGTKWYATTPTLDLAQGWSSYFESKFNKESIHA